MRMQVRSWRCSLTTGIGLLAAAGFTACGGREPPPGPTPAAGCPSGTAPSTPQELEICLRGLNFDSSDEASDRQVLTVIDTISSPGSVPCPGDASGKLTCRYGPMASIEPLKGAQRYSEADLRQGRIIARIRVPPGEKDGYEKYGLAPGQDTYWWVRTDPGDTTGTSVFVTRGPEPKLRQVKRPLKRQRDRYDPESQQWRSAARWIWKLEDEVAKAKCSSGSCQ